MTSSVLADRIGAVADDRYELLGHLESGNLFAEPYLVTLLSGADSYVTFQHPGVKFLAACRTRGARR